MQQEVVVSSIFLGTSLQFSDRLIRILNFEFREVRFVRRPDAATLADVAPRPKLVILHESQPGLADAIGTVRAVLPDAMAAVACANPAAFRSILDPDIARSVTPISFNTPIDVWLSVLRLLLCGHSYIPAELTAASERTARDATPCAHSIKPDDVSRLTQRENQVLALIAQGLQNKVIAGSLDVSEHTVKLHIHNIFAKLGVSNRTGAATWYLSQVAAAESPGQRHGE